jgi:hypothetical protein
MRRDALAQLLEAQLDLPLDALRRRPGPEPGEERLKKK